MLMNTDLKTVRGLVQSPCGKINVISYDDVNFLPPSLNVTAFQHRFNTETDSAPFSQHIR